MKIETMKVSGTGWLCALLPDGHSWILICKLTAEQIRLYQEVADEFSKFEKVRK